MRLRLSRRRSEEEKTAGQMYGLVQYVPVESTKGLKCERVHVE